MAYIKPSVLPLMHKNLAFSEVMRVRITGACQP